MIGFLSLLIIATVLVSNFRALKIMVIIEHSFFGILFLASYLDFESWFDYNGSSAPIYDAPKDINQKPEENELNLFYFVMNLTVIIAALLMENIWCLKILSMINPIGLLFTCLVTIFVPEIEVE